MKIKDVIFPILGCLFISFVLIITFLLIIFLFDFHNTKFKRRDLNNLDDKVVVKKDKDVQLV